MSPNERLNNIIFERTIEYLNTSPPSKFHGKRIQRYLRDRKHTERKTKVHVACSHVHHVLSRLSYQFTGRDMHLQKISGMAIFVLKGMWVFQNITIHTYISLFSNNYFNKFDMPTGS